VEVSKKKGPSTFQSNVHPSVHFQTSTSVASKAAMNEAQESALDAPPRTPRESENTLQLLASTGSTVTQWRASSRFIVDGCFSLPCFDNSANEPCNFAKF